MNTTSKSLSSSTKSTKLATQKDLFKVRDELRSEFREAIAELLITMGENFDRIDATFATKDDLKKFATKDDLKRFATKEDLKNFATKDDLQNEIEKLNKQIANLPTKDEFYSYMDRMLGEYKTFNQESTILSGRISDHEDRIVTLEKVAFN